MSEGELSDVSVAIFFIFFSLTIGGLITEVTKKIKIPYPAAVFLFGIVIGSYQSSIHDHLLKESITMTQNLKASSLMGLLIPAMVFHSAFTTDIYIMKKQILQIVVLSIPSLIISATLIAISLKLLLEYSDDYYSWGFAVVFGTIVSCTDTMQVIKLLNDAEAPKKFISLVQGESLVNNGASMILLLIAVQCARGTCGQISNTIQYAISVVLGSSLIALIFGLFSVFWVRRVNHNAILTINLSIVSAYLTYFVAEYVDMGFAKNGLVAVIVLGLFMSAFTKIRIRTDCEHPLEIFWQYVSFSVETIIFLITGLSSGIRIFDQHSPFISHDDYFKLLLLYAYILGARFVAVLVLLPLINSVGQSVKFSEALLFTFSGARGAVQLNMALLVFQEPSFSQQWSDILLFHITGIVILTLIINGSTTSILVRFLGLSTYGQGRAKVKLNFLQEMRDQIEIKINQMKQDHHDLNIDWVKIIDFSGLEETTKYIQSKDEKLNLKQQKEDRLKMKSQENTLEFKFLKLLRSVQAQDTVEDDVEVDEDSIRETRERFLMALNQTYWDLYSQNQCGGKAYNLLVESVRWDLDTVEQRMCSWDFVYNLFYSPLYMRFLYWMIRLPFLGKFAGSMLFDWVGMGYEVISTYVKAHQEMEMMIEDFPIPQQLQRIIAKESSENRNNAEHFIEAYLQVSFPEIIRLIQTKKAAQGNLASQSQYMDRKFQLGEIEAQEYNKLKLQLNKFVCITEDIKPQWPNVRTYMKLKQVPLFKEFDDKLLRQLAAQSKELIYDKDQCITREGELARCVYVILRGRAIETCQNTFNNYTQTRDIGSIISPHHIVLQATIYITQTIADAMVEVIAIDIESIIKLFRKSKFMQEYLWAESLYALSRFYPKEMKPLSIMEHDTIDTLKSYLIYEKHKVDTHLQVQAAIILSGKIEDLTQDGVKREESSNSEFEQKSNIFFGPLVLPFKKGTHHIVTKSVVCCLLFDPTKKEDIMKLISQEMSMDRTRSKFLPDARQASPNVNRQSFGFSYLLRHSKVANEQSDHVQSQRQV